VSQATLVLTVRDDSHVGAARRAAAGEAERVGADEERTGTVALVATELATNLVRHGGGGEILLRVLTEPMAALELVALDRGPGMASVEQALSDGYSSAGTSGTGLGAVRRMADHCDIFSAPGLGTAVLVRCRLTADPLSGPEPVAGVSIAMPGETACGDDWSWTGPADGWSVMVADGLGHGPDAAVASAEAVRIFRQQAGRPGAEILAAANAALRHTRGAALAVAELRGSELRFTGIGNIGGVILSADGPRSLVSHAGIVGHECRKIQTFSHAWSKGSLLVLFSDGLQTRWTLDRYPALRLRDPALLATVLYRDFARGRDDVTVVAARGAEAA
jgi:anti-sigma regulatory factor (Ser/Thr protein kinase)